MRKRLVLIVSVVVGLSTGACSGSNPTGPTLPLTQTIPETGPSPSQAVAAMLEELPSYIAGALAGNQSSLPRNPHLAAQIQAKIDMLQSPTLVADIRNGQRYAEGAVTSTDGRTIAVATVFPQETMRLEASEAIDFLVLAFPILENFMATAFPPGVIRMWYGFVIGNSGGGGTLNMEDRSTFESRTGPGWPLPYEGILAHELAHTYIRHEALTQLLEAYTYNVVHTGSTSVGSWSFLRSCVVSLQTNEGVCALLDVYELLGRDAMSLAYKATYPLSPPYGQPLSSQVRQVFVDQAPAGLKAQVAAKMDRVVY